MICRKAVSAFDLSTYILASFATVEDVRRALSPADFSVVNFHLSEPAMALLKREGLLAPGGHPLIHLGVNDAKHDSIVIEFIKGPLLQSQPFLQQWTNHWRKWRNYSFCCLAVMSSHERRMRLQAHACRQYACCQGEPCWRTYQ